MELVHSSSESSDASTRNIALKLYNALLVCPTAMYVNVVILSTSKIIIFNPY